MNQTTSSLAEYKGETGLPWKTRVILVGRNKEEGKLNESRAQIVSALGETYKILKPNAWAGIGLPPGPTHILTHVVAKKTETNYMTFDDISALQQLTMNEFDHFLDITYTGPSLNTKPAFRTFFTDPEAKSRSQSIIAALGNRPVSNEVEMLFQKEQDWDGDDEPQDLDDE